MLSLVLLDLSGSVVGLYLVRGSVFLSALQRRRPACPFEAPEALLLRWCSWWSCTFTAPSGYAAPRSPRCGSLGFMVPLMWCHGSRNSLVAPWVLQFHAPHILQLPKFLRLHRCKFCGSLKLCCSTGAATGSLSFAAPLVLLLAL